MTDAKQSPADADKRIQTALRRFKLVSDAEADQRQAELDDLEFVDLEKQWPDDVKERRKAGVLNGVPFNAQPCLTINKLGAPIRQVVNQARSARLGVNISPKDSKASEETAEMLEGLYRNIEVESRAQVARMWAFSRAAKCGRGYYRILKEYANDGDDDLDLVIKRILNQHSVYLDPFHQEPDGSDARWAFIVDDMPLDAYRAEFGESAVALMEDEELTGLGDAAPGWVGGDSEESRTVRVAEYFYVENSKTKNAQGREVSARKVCWVKMNAHEILDEQEWDGRYIPIVQVVGEEVNVNGERVYKGIVRPAKDAQRSYNYMRSSEVETIGLAPKAPWMIPEGAIEGYEKIWQWANLKNFPWLPFRQKNLGGNLTSPPTRNIEEPAIQAVSFASRQAAEDLQSITGVFHEAEGRSSGPSQSGRAIQALQQQSEHSNSNYLQDFADVAMVHEARIILDLIPKIYDRPGRIVKILTGDNDQASSVMLNQAFVEGPGGQPMPMPAPGEQPPAPIPQGAQPKHYDLSNGQYGVTINIGKSFTSRRQEAAVMLGELAQAAPETVPMWADIWVRNLDIPGGNEIADRLTPPQFKKGADGQQPDPEKALLQQQLQVMAQKLQEAESGIAKAQIDAESREKIKGAELASKAEIEQMKAELAQLKISVEAGLKLRQIAADEHATIVKAQIERESDERAIAAQRESEAHARAHEHATQAVEQGHQSRTRGVDLQHEREMADTQHIHAKDLQASAPPPKGKAN